MLSHGISLIFQGKMLDAIFRKKMRLKAKYGNSDTSSQAQMLVKILRYANTNCPYYRDLGIDVSSADDLLAYPLLTKEIIRSDFARLTSENASRMSYGVSRTGGSTGEPLEFLNSSGVDDVFQEKLWRRNGYSDGDIILAMDGAKVSYEAISRHDYLYKKSAKQLPYGGYGLSSLYLNEDNIDEYCDALIRLKPDFIRGYPSFVHRIARHMREGGIKPSWQIKAIELTSESSFDYQRAEIAKAFNSKVIMQYGHTECCVFAYTFDSTMRYKVEPLYGFVEVLDSDGNHVDVGETGEVVVTSLHNYVMPLIRYKTGDYAVYGGTSEDGIILDEVLGRTQDYIVNKEGKKVLLTALIFAQHFPSLGKIRQWQIEQWQPGSILIHVVPSEDYEAADEEEIRNLFCSLGNVDVAFHYASSIELTGRGKSKMIVQHIELV